MKRTIAPEAVELCEVNALFIPENGAFPNHPRWPLLIYRQALPLDYPDPAAGVEALFKSNGWHGAWRDGIYSFHHFHSNAHEVLGCCRGSASVLFGGPHGYRLNLRAGDAVLLPAGTAHKRVEASRDFMVVGAYPGDADYDMCYGKPGEHEAAARNIASVPLPERDPLFGKKGGLRSLWKAHA
jgi:uncharacterized protein YjlB